MEKFLKNLIWAGLIAVFFIPLITKSTFYYPFIVPKSIAFRVIIEIILLAFLILAMLNKEYRPKINLALILFALYLITVFASSVLAGTFYLSFWSNNERSEGLLLLLHLFAFLFVLCGFLKKPKDWLLLLDISFLGSIIVSLYAMAQYFNITLSGIIRESSGGERLAATIGNAAYVAGYLIFNIFFGIFLYYFRDNNKYLRWYYLAGIFLQIFIVLNTLTRGGILSLFLCLALFIGYLIFFSPKTAKSIKLAGAGILIFLVIFSGIVYLNKQADWVRGNNILLRITEISIKEVTAQNRLLTWNSALRGFKDKPILGYGYENFYQVFDRYFEPGIYRKVGSTIWYDRGHNIIFDRLITGGLIGLLLYLALLFLPVVYLWKHFRKNRQIIKHGYLMAVIFSLAMLAYFIQNLFIFEALVTYIPLFFALAFLSQFCPNYLEKFSQSKKFYSGLVIAGVILFFPILYGVNIKPAIANQGLVQAIVMTNSTQYQESYNKFIEVLDMNTFGNQEYRQHFGEFVAAAAKSQEIDEAWRRKAAKKAEEEFDKQIAEKPWQVRNYMMVMRFLNETHKFDINRLNKSLELFDKAVELSPPRPMVYYEGAYSQLYLGNYYKGLDQTDKAEELYQKAIANMKKSVDLNDKVVESYVNLALVLLASNHTDELQFWVDKADELGRNYLVEDRLTRMASAAVNAREYQWATKFYSRLTNLYPQKADYWTSLALAYAYSGDRDNAIKIAELVKGFGGDYVGGANYFIQQVQANAFEK